MVLLFDRQSFDGFGTSILTMFRLVLFDFDIDDFSKNWLAGVLFLVFCTMAGIILLNLLIGQVSKAPL
jgi:Ion transport protein